MIRNTEQSMFPFTCWQLTISRKIRKVSVIGFESSYYCFSSSGERMSTFDLFLTFKEAAIYAIDSLIEEKKVINTRLDKIEEKLYQITKGDDDDLSS